MQPDQPRVVAPAANPATLPPAMPGVTPVGDGMVQVDPRLMAQNMPKAVSVVRHKYADPAFWCHLALQVVMWLSYFQAASTSLKDVSLTGSLGTFFGYLIHLVKTK